MAIDRYIPQLRAPKNPEDIASKLYLQEELRKLWEAVHTLTGRSGTIPLMDSVSVTGDGSFSGALTATAVYGAWSRSANTAGTGNFSLTNEDLNTNTTYFTRNTTDSTVRINIPGKYLYLATYNAETDANGDAIIRQVVDGSPILFPNIRFDALPAGAFIGGTLALVVDAEEGTAIATELNTGATRRSGQLLLIKLN